jgi:CHAT domain-containing protein
VVIALWDLEDLATARMMQTFYRNLSDREPKESALRDAQLEIMKAGLPPYYWASVELLGDPSGSI